MSSKEVSVVIPTYKRYEDIIKTLESLNNQTLPPDEVIIFDESPTDELRRIIKAQRFCYPVKYIRSPSKFRSLARSRNKAKKLVKGRTVVFLDDDVILSPDYLERIVKFFSDNSHVKGVTGLIINQTKLSKIYQLMNMVFLRPHKTEVPAVQRSFVPTYPEPSMFKSAPAQWLSGCNMAYRREVLESMDFDWRLLKYSYSEDVDFSFRVYKKYGEGSLWLLPDAKLIHNQSPSGRLLGFNLEAHRRVVNLYMLYKHFGDTRLNILVFLWWNIGEILEQVLGGILHGELRDRIKNVKVILKAMKFTFENFGRIKKGDIIQLQL
ncbi:Glycosyltransferase, family 2 [Thermococcus gammatolerans EJ3]|uniref:Glycosyltransferase, family 2 n=1 Tax=Thermococcus gammatolerans (strain DSM 15229 / JCM 11827 / EJ3) TaxID=593117 RepID=C5A2Y2_THEGJ|nr:Glycosyltransferase, family 2 [Thermococcus gammatolerans EJ3]